MGILQVLRFWILEGQIWEFLNVHPMFISYSSLLHADLINVGYLKACVFISSWWCSTFWMTRKWCWIATKIDITSYCYSEPMGKLINRIPGSHLLISSLPGSALRTYIQCLNRSASLAIHQAFSKPCLVNLISKDTQCWWGSWVTFTVVFGCHFVIIPPTIVCWLWFYCFHIVHGSVCGVYTVFRLSVHL